MAVTYKKKGKPKTETKSGDLLTETPIEKWLRLSMEPQPYEVIRENAILDSYDGQNRICYSYVCGCQELTEEQIEELMVITSPFYTMMSSLTPENQAVAVAILDLANDKKQIDFMRILVKSGKLADKRFETNLKVLLNKDSFSKGKIEDRLDWKELDKQKLSKRFKEKHKELLKQPIQYTPRVKTVVMPESEW